MARPLRIQYPGAFYHILSRGNEGKSIYGNDQDREAFLRYIERAHKRFGIIIHAYCLMKNHYHLLMETLEGNLSRSMQYINSSYTMYYNLRNKRNGHLLQGRYKSILLEKDSYFLELGRYIHLNPARAGIVKNPEDYLWSSYKYYLDLKREKPEYLELKTTLEEFRTIKEYRKFINEGIGVKDPLEGAAAGCILGQEEFIEKIKEKYLNGEDADLRELPEKKHLLGNKISKEKIEKLLLNEEGESEKKKLLVYFLWRHSGLTLEEIRSQISGKKISISGISQIARRVEKRGEEDRDYARKLIKIEKEMSNV